MTGLAFLGWVAIAFTIAALVTGFVKLRAWVHCECEDCGRWFRVTPFNAARLLRDGCPHCNPPETRE